jgi:hypothetical protein
MQVNDTYILCVPFIIFIVAGLYLHAPKAEDLQVVPPTVSSNDVAYLADEVPRSKGEYLSLGGLTILSQMSSINFIAYNNNQAN